MLINAPKSVLAFSYPSLFVFDNTIYRSIEDFVRKKSESFASTIKPSDRVDVSSLENELFSIYENAIETNLRQNRFAREALIRTKNALLVDVRQINQSGHILSRHLSCTLGCFEGNSDDFGSYLDRNGLAAQTLSRFWRYNFVPRLKSVGKNRLGIKFFEYN